MDPFLLSTLHFIERQWDDISLLDKFRFEYANTGCVCAFTNLYNIYILIRKDTQSKFPILLAYILIVLIIFTCLYKKV